MKGITQKHYKALILASIDNDGYAADELNSGHDKIHFAAETLRAELGWMIERERLGGTCVHWLQGLASACTIPFYNGDIIKWAEGILGRELTDRESDRLLEEYWVNAARALQVMIERHDAGRSSL